MASNLSNVYHFFKIYIYTILYYTHTHIYIYISINRISYIFYTQNIFKDKIN